MITPTCDAAEAHQQLLSVLIQLRVYEACSSSVSDVTANSRAVASIRWSLKLCETNPGTSGKQEETETTRPRESERERESQEGKQA